MANLPASNDQGFQRFINDAKEVKMQIETTKIRIKTAEEAENHAAAVVAQNQNIRRDGESKLRGLFARMDRYKELVAIVNEQNSINSTPAAESLTPPLLAPAVLQGVQTEPNEVDPRESEEVNSKDDDHDEEHVDDPPLLKYSIIHTDFPTVMYVNNAWADVRCGICGANANLSSRQFFRGVPGLLAHMQVHRETGSSSLPGAKTFAARKLTAEEVNELKNGKQPKSKSIKKVFTTAHRPSNAPVAPMLPLA